MAMTVGEQLIQQGFEEGLKLGRQEVQRAFLLRHIPGRLGIPAPVVEARIAALDDDAIDASIDRVFEATTLDELFPTP
jgi:hypothetical protein